MVYTPALLPAIQPSVQTGIPKVVQVKFACSFPLALVRGQTKLVADVTTRGTRSPFGSRQVTHRTAVNSSTTAVVQLWVVVIRVGIALYRQSAWKTHVVNHLVKDRKLNTWFMYSLNKIRNLHSGKHQSATVAIDPTALFPRTTFEYTSSKKYLQQIQHHAKVLVLGPYPCRLEYMSQFPVICSISSHI